MCRLVYIGYPPPLPGSCSDVAEMRATDHLLQDHLPKKHVRLGHLSRPQLDLVKGRAAKVKACSPQQKMEKKWELAYQYLHGLANAHPIPSPCRYPIRHAENLFESVTLTLNTDYERLYLKSQLEKTQDLPAPPQDPCHFGQRNFREAPSPLMRMLLEPPTELAPSALDLTDHSLPPSDLNWDQFLLPEAQPPGLHSPTQHSFDEKPLSIDVVGNNYTTQHSLMDNL
jgi:hypothetical protein